MHIINHALLGLNLFKFGWLIFKAGFWDFWGGQAPLFGFFCGHNAWAQWTCRMTWIGRIPTTSRPCSSPCRSAARAARAARSDVAVCAAVCAAAVLLVVVIVAVLIRLVCVGHHLRHDTLYVRRVGRVLSGAMEGAVRARMPAVRPYDVCTVT